MSATELKTRAQARHSRQQQRKLQLMRRKTSQSQPTRQQRTTQGQMLSCSRRMSLSTGRAPQQPSALLGWQQQGHALRAQQLSLRGAASHSAAAAARNPNRDQQLQERAPSHSMMKQIAKAEQLLQEQKQIGTRCEQVLQQQRCLSSPVGRAR